MEPFTQRAPWGPRGLVADVVATHLSLFLSALSQVTPETGTQVMRMRVGAASPLSLRP